MAECRSLIELLLAFEHHSRAADSSASASASACSRSRRASAAAGGSVSVSGTGSAAFCDSTPMVVVDAMMMLAIVTALGFLLILYLKLLFLEAGVLLHHPAATYLPAVAFFGATVAVAAAVVAWELLGHHARKCGKPGCRGLKKAVEFDIQLETEECVRSAFGLSGGAPTHAAPSRVPCLPVPPSQHHYLYAEAATPSTERVARASLRSCGRAAEAPSRRATKRLRRQK